MDTSTCAVEFPILERAGGMGQELFNAIVLGLAVVMLAWHNIRMSSHGAELAKNARSVGVTISDGRSECSVLLLIVGLAVLREGSEATLFLYGIAASEGAGALPYANWRISWTVDWSGHWICALRRFAACSDALVFCGHGYVDIVSSRRHGLAFGTFFNPGRLAA